MADQPEVTTPDPETIRRKMEATRSSLAEKLEVLEQKVTDTVEGATSAVTETVENVKETVTETVEAVKDTVEETVESVAKAFNLSEQVQRYPWAMFGGSVALGFVGGLLLGPARPWGQAERPTPSSPLLEEAPEPVASYTPPTSREAETRRPGWWDQLLSTFGSEIDKVKGLALGALGGIVRDLAAEVVPENVKPMVTDLINDVTSKLGGHTIEGRVLPESQSRQRTGTPSYTS
jgi:ElaB/YqjD/DUF883 family membrane-anchored ribosome-binding protein